jgi:hypothetical protein
MLLDGVLVLALFIAPVAGLIWIAQDLLRSRRGGSTRKE